MKLVSYLLAAGLLANLSGLVSAVEPAPDWTRADRQTAMTAGETAAAQWLLVLDGKNDWEQQRVPSLR